MSMGMVKKILGQEIHLEVRHGTREQARDYCKKEETRIEGPYEIGVYNPLQQGRRSDLEKLKADVKLGHSMGKIADEYFGDFVRYGRGIREYMHLQNSTKPRPKTDVYVFVGPPGTGKSHCANEWGQESAYWVPRSTSGVWFDGYDGQDTIIFDEFYGWLPFDMLLRITDKWPLLVPTKGGHVRFMSLHCIFTSNKMPHLWYRSVEFRAFERRVAAWYYFSKVEDPQRFETYDELRDYVELPTEEERKLLQRLDNNNN